MNYPEPVDLSAFGRLVRERREAKQMTVIDAAMQLGISQSSLYRLETGRAGRMRAASLADIARLVEITPAEVRELVDDERLAAQVIAKLAIEPPVSGYYRASSLAAPIPTAADETEYVATRNGSPEVRLVMRPGPAADELVAALQELGYRVLVALN